MLSRCQGAARASCSAREGELGAAGNSKAGRIFDLPNKKSGSLDSQDQDQVQEQWLGSALVQCQPCKSIVIRLVQGQAEKSSQPVRIRTEEVFGLDKEL